MISPPNRRDFLRLAAGLAAGSAASRLTGMGAERILQPSPPSIIILVLDAMSARNLSLYGYPRNTTPNLERLAERATVYHSHYAAGNFTTSGTASLLTGLEPWTHRGINMGGLVHRAYEDRSIFHHLHDDYYTAAFSQNYYAHVLLAQFRGAIDRLIPAASFSVPGDAALLERYFPRDPVPTYYAIEETGFTASGMPSAPIFDLLRELGEGQKIDRRPSSVYPYGMPDNAVFRFENASVYDGIREEILALNASGRPILGYFHLFAPHEPYAPRKQFVDIFPAMDFPYKRPNRLSSLDVTRESITHQRKRYDEYIADVDYEVGRLVDALDAAGTLGNSYLVITSDHGELFERGEYGHVTRFLYEGVIHIPLLILAPGQTSRVDIHAPTSNADLVPTVLRMAGKGVPGGLEGLPLPGFGGEEDAGRPIFALEAKESSSFGPLPHATVTLVRDGHKLIYYTGYRKLPDIFELYDLREDPEEQKDLFADSPTMTKRMKEELLETFESSRAGEPKS